MTQLLDILNTTDAPAALKYQIMQRTGPSPIARPADDFPRLSIEGTALRRLEMLKTWYVAQGYEVRDSDEKAKTLTMNPGFVVTFQGKFEAAYEIVSVEEQP